ncbi:MAG: class I SAM-dependent methyltransferase [Myxococcota bacterium]|nr:class I SAM-dependent methyltransferase [Myxococcota bacterium]
MEAAEHTRLAEHEEWYWWHRARERIVHRALERWAPPDPRILDVGCGTGHTTASLRRFGPVVGVDLGSEALRRARERSLPVARSSASPLPVPSQRFDVVVALDVLEHLDDDVGAAREILRSLAPGGLLVATVPAYAFLWSSHDVALGHRRRYRRAALARVLREAGFAIERCSYVMSAILPVAALLRLAERLRPPRHESAQSGYVPVPRWVNELLTAVVGFDGRIVQHAVLPFGLSVLAVARRPAPSAQCGGTAGDRDAGA